MLHLLCLNVGGFHKVGETFFVLEEGVAVVTQNRGGVVKELRRLGEYTCFGERALLTAEPRSANVVAESRVSDGIPCGWLSCYDWL